MAAKNDERLFYLLGAVMLAGIMQNTFRDSEFCFGYWVSVGLLIGEVYKPLKSSFET